MKTLDQRFLEYHQKYPEVYARLEELALAEMTSGSSKIGIKALFEKLRWKEQMGVTDPSGYKLNNSFTSRYARMLIQHLPAFESYIETRELLSPYDETIISEKSKPDGFVFGL